MNISMKMTENIFAAAFNLYSLFSAKYQLFPMKEMSTSDFLFKRNSQMVEMYKINTVEKLSYFGAVS